MKIPIRRYLNALMLTGLIFLFVIGNLNCHAIASTAGIERIEKSYTLQDFQISYNSLGEMEIFAYGESNAFYGDTYAPMLPLLEYRYAIPYDKNVDTIEFSTSKRIVATNVILAANPAVVPLDGNEYDVQSSLPANYQAKRFPTSPCLLSNVTIWDGIKVAHIVISPFEYDAEKKILYFNETVSGNIRFTPDNNAAKGRLGTTNTVANLVKACVENSSVVDNYIEMIDNKYPKAPVSLNNRIDYLIITSTSLKDAFEPLRRWREREGLKTKIATTEEIYASSKLATKQLKIKSYIRDLYEKNGLRFVLLGGDDIIVPAQYCYAEVKSGDNVTAEPKMPSDMFYASTTGDFAWDANQNGVIGEMGVDDVQKSISLFLSRLPARTPIDATNMITKIIKYETHPNWNGKMLLSGTKVTRNPEDEYQNDAELQSILGYRAYLGSTWSGDTLCFFDSRTSFAGNRDYDVTASNFNKELGNGYDYLTMLSHGNYDSWLLENSEHYTSKLAKNVKNKGYTIISTAACNTNGFDCSETEFPYGCLSESLMRNPDSGVVAYWGCSRLSWGSAGTKNLGDNVAKIFYNLSHILRPSRSCDTWGEACAKTKTNSLIIHEYHYWHWLGFNPIGDPTFQPYTDNPSKFSNTAIQCDGNSLVISNNRDDASFCIMSTDTNEPYFYKVGTGNVTLSKEFPLCGSIVVSKKDFIPKTYSYSFVQNENITEDKVFMGNFVCLGAEVTKAKDAGDVICKKGAKITVKGDELLLDKGFCVEQGAELEYLPFNELEL